MIILQVFDLFSLKYGGGTVDVITKLSKALMSRGHRVEICTSNYKLDRVEGLNFEVFHSLINLPNIRVASINIELRYYDVVHFHCYRSYMNAVMYEKAMKHGVPFIIDAHGSTVDRLDFMTPLRKIFDKSIGHRALRNAKHIIAETEVGVKEFERLGVSRDKVTILHPMFDTSEFDNLPLKGLFRKRHGLEHKRIVLFLGRIHWAKGLEFLMNAFAHLDVNIVLVMVGQDDGYQAHLQSLAEQFGVQDRVLFTGYLNGEDKLSALVDANVLVQPSLNEAGARPSLEAILCGTPCIVTRNTGAGQEIEKMGGGYLVNYDNWAELGITINYVMMHKEEALAKVEKAKQYIKENLSLEKQVVKYEQLYR